ncbi:MAG: DUF342 domain-containing protein [Planctomycetes bacterium]|nr:DUF342 domain-containing protein [Planctomycetota bacterium]
MIIAPDKLSAAIRFCDGGDPTPPTQEEILEALEGQHVAAGPEVVDRVDEFLRLLSSDEVPEEEFMVAEGGAPVEGEDEEFTLDEAYAHQEQNWQLDAPINYYKFSAIVTVEAETVIGRIPPLVPSESGIDVLGAEIRPQREPQPMELDATVRRSSEDGSQIIANISGRVVIDKKQLSIREALLIHGDVDFETCNINSRVDVDVKGSVLDRFEVNSGGTITIGGVIEAAKVTAKSDIFVCGGIMGRHSGLVFACGEIVARFAHEADLVADGSIKIHSELMACRVQTEDSLIAEHGSVIGGYIYAREGVTIGTLGSDAYVPTNVIVGFHPRVLREATKFSATMKREQKELERQRRVMEALSVDEKRLNEEQLRECADLHVKSAALEFKIADVEAERSQLLADARAQNSPAVRVLSIVYPGTTISIGWHTTTIKHELKGPVSIELREIDEDVTFVAVNQLTGTVDHLETEEVSADDLLAGLQRDDVTKIELPT